jgi:hypothetical protein
METTGIRIEVSSEFYSKLIDEQEKQRKLSGKKPALANVILELSKSGLKHKYEDKSILASELHYQTTSTTQTVELKNMLLKKEQEIKEREKELDAREVEIRNREFDLIERDKSVSKKTIILMEQREELSHQKEQMNSKSTELIKLNILNENLNDQLCEKENQIIFFQKDINEMKNKTYKLLIRIDSNTQTSTFMKYIVPFLPVVSSIIGAVILGKKIENKENLGEVEIEILKQFNSLNPDAQSEVKKYMEEVLCKSK